MKKAAMKKGVIGLASFIAIIASATAASALFIPQQMQDILKYIFIDLARLGITGDTSAIIAFKFMLWVLAFTLFYFGISKSKVFGDDAGKKNIAVIVSIVLALMTSIMLPSSLVMTLFQTYAAIGGIILVALPVIFGIWIGNKWLTEPTKWHYFLRAVILFIVAYVLGTLLASLLVTGQQIYLTFYEWGTWGVIGCIIAGIVNMLRVMAPGEKVLQWRVKEKEKEAAEKEKEEEKELNKISNDIKNLNSAKSTMTTTTRDAKNASEECRRIWGQLRGRIPALSALYEKIKSGKNLTEEERREIVTTQGLVKEMNSCFNQLDDALKIHRKWYAQVLDGSNALQRHASKEHEGSRSYLQELTRIETLIGVQIKSPGVKAKIVEKFESLKKNDQKKVDDAVSIENNANSLSKSLEIISGLLDDANANKKKLYAKLNPFWTLALTGIPTFKKILSYIPVVKNVLSWEGDIGQLYDHINSDLVTIEQELTKSKVPPEQDVIKIMSDLQTGHAGLAEVEKEIDSQNNAEAILGQKETVLRTWLTNVISAVTEQKEDLAAASGAKKLAAAEAAIDAALKRGRNLYVITIDKIINEYIEDYKAAYFNAHGTNAAKADGIVSSLKNIATVEQGIEQNIKRFMPAGDAKDAEVSAELTVEIKSALDEVTELEGMAKQVLVVPQSIEATERL